MGRSERSISQSEAGGNGNGAAEMSRAASRKEGRANVVMQTIDGKIFAVDGENLSDAFSLGYAVKGGVGKIHGTLRVLAHQLAYPGNVCGL
jgi:hypothetical protein